MTTQTGQVNIPLFTSSYIEKLYRNSQKKNGQEAYQKEKFSCQENFAKGDSGIKIDEGFYLDPTAGDLANSKKLYNQLDLNETQASDPRLWTYLTHVTFWDYMKERWPVDKNSIKNPQNRIRNRYFLRTLNLRTLTRNGLSRLWWYAKITVDSNRENKFELTNILLKRADLTVGITERAIGSSQIIRTALLEFLNKNKEILNSEKKSRELFTGLNLSGGPKTLSFLTKEEVKRILEKVKQNII